MRFYSGKSYSPDELLELSIILHPDNYCLLIIGTVVWCEEDPEADDDERFALAVDYTYIDDADREILVKHIHQLQLRLINEEKASKELRELEGRDRDTDDIELEDDDSLEEPV